MALAFKDPTPGDDGGGSRTHVYGANTHTGDTTISHSGIKDPGVFLNNALALQNSTLDYNVTASDTTLLWFNSTVGAATGFTFGRLKGSKNLKLSAQGNSARNLKIGNNNQDPTFNGVISSSNDILAGITKIGNGTLTLTKACTYTGPTVVAGGTLALSSTGNQGTHRPARLRNRPGGGCRS